MATFDLDKLTGQMLLDFEERVGQPLQKMLDNDGTVDIKELSTTALIGVIWLALRTEDDGATWEDALRTPFTSIMVDGAEDPAPDPS